MQTVKASDFYSDPGLLKVYELHIGDEWRVVAGIDVFRMPNSPILFYSEFPEGEVSVHRDEMIEVRPRQV